LKSNIISEQENLSLKVKEQVNLKFKSEGNKIQFRFNEEIAADLAKLQKHCTSSVNNFLNMFNGSVFSLANSFFVI
jgi:predicted DNA-binding antitoxin AbrB/MazE fold protein